MWIRDVNGDWVNLDSVARIGLEALPYGGFGIIAMWPNKGAIISNHKLREDAEKERDEIMAKLNNDQESAVEKLAAECDEAFNLIRATLESYAAILQRLEAEKG